MISPLVKWEHSKDWFIPSIKSQEKTTFGERVVKVSVSDSAYESWAGHVVDGEYLFPVAGYLTLIWETLGMMRQTIHTVLSVVFEDVKFFSILTIPKDGQVELTAMIQKGDKFFIEIFDTMETMEQYCIFSGTGMFEILQGDTLVVTGYVRSTAQPAEEKLNSCLSPNDEKELMTSEDVYKELRLRGYGYDGIFRGIRRATTTGSRGHILWQNDWAAFLDNMLQMVLLGMDHRGLLVPIAIEKLVIDTDAHFNQMKPGETDNGEIHILIK